MIGLIKRIGVPGAVTAVATIVTGTYAALQYPDYTWLWWFPLIFGFCSSGFAYLWMNIERFNQEEEGSDEEMYLWSPKKHNHVPGARENDELKRSSVGYRWYVHKPEHMGLDGLIRRILSNVHRIKRDFV
jgi:hypothetical protein